MPERKIQYDSVNNRKNAGLVLHAPSLERLYIDAALSLTDRQVSLDLVRDPQKQQVKVEGESRDVLMIKWLNAILTLFEQQKFLPKRIVFNHFDGKKIQATLFGDVYEPTRHGAISILQPLTKQNLQIGDSTEPGMNFSVKILAD